MLVYDIEIEKAILGKNETPKANIKYCNGWGDFKNMGIAVIGVYDLNIGRTRVFLKDNLQEFGKLVEETDCIVGFNNHRFDNQLLLANGLMIKSGKSYDILEEIWRSLGLSMEYKWQTHGGLSLDELAYANFKIRKTGTGMKAPIDWQEGRRGSVIDYCLSDVEITRRLLNRITNRGSLKHPKTSQEIFIKKPSPEVKYG